MLRVEKLDYHLSIKTVYSLVFIFLIFYMFKSFLYDNVDNSIKHEVADSNQISTEKKIIESSPIDNRNIMWLAKNNYYESRGVAGQDFDNKKEDMKNISQVVMNRLKAKRFGSTIEKVIKYKNPKSGVCHFSWVCQKNLKKIDYKSEEWKLAHEVAYDVYFGLIDNNISDDALHYYNPLVVKPRWAINMIEVAYVKSGHRIIR